MRSKGSASLLSALVTVPVDVSWNWFARLMKSSFFIFSLDKTLIAQSAKGIALIGPLSDVRKMIPSAYLWMSLALRF